VANGFPNYLIGADEAMVSKDLLDILSLKVGDKLLVKYDFLTFLPPKFSIFQTILFDEIPEEINTKNLTRGMYEYYSF